MGKKVLRKHGKHRELERLEVSVEKSGEGYDGNVFCPVEKCGKVVKIWARKTGSWSNSNFVRHIQRNHPG